jgi:leucyl/phenylalanyl-tRNA--protein transferase
MKEISADDLMYGYAHGVFPMAEKDGTIYWYSPDPRAIIPIELYKPSRSLRPIINQGVFEVKINQNFEMVMRGCAELHHLGFAHSIECYQNDQLVGGLYGVALGAAFFGESMFHTVSNASKVAFHYLIQILRQRSYHLLDTQFTNENVDRYGAVEIPREEYLKRLRKACSAKRTFGLS